MYSDNTFDRLKRESQEKPLSRRDFMRVLTAASAAGPGIITAGLSGFSLTNSQRSEAAEAIVEGLGTLPKVKLSKRMGGIEVGRIVICSDSASDLIAPSLAAGMNFIHKASFYYRRGGVPEEVKKIPRESYYTDITVENTSPGHDPTNFDEAYNQVVTELDKTGLKYFDVFRAHYGWHTVDSFNKGDNASYRAFLKLKKEGKVKYFGVSQHAAPRENYETYMTMVQAQIDSGLIDSIQLWCSYETTKEELAVFEKAHKAGIAITAMKTYRHGSRKMKSDPAKQAELKSPDLVARACLRYVLSLKGSDGKPFIDCAVSNLQNTTQFEENLGSVATKVSMRDGFALPIA